MTRKPKRNRKPKPTYVEKLLEKHRKNPTPTIRDRKQKDLIELINQKGLEDRTKDNAFTRLDEAIAAVLADREDGK